MNYDWCVKKLDSLLINETFPESLDYYNSHCFTDYCLDSNFVEYLLKHFNDSSKIIRDQVNTIFYKMSIPYFGPDEALNSSLLRLFGTVDILKKKHIVKMYSQALIRYMTFNRCKSFCENSDVQNFIVNKVIPISEFKEKDWKDQQNKAYLYLLSSYNFRLYRNSIFAKYGYVFQDVKLQSYFETMKWYNKNSEFKNYDISAKDHSNIRIAKEVQKIRKKFITR